MSAFLDVLRDLPLLLLPMAAGALFRFSLRGSRWAWLAAAAPALLALVLLLVPAHGSEFHAITACVNAGLAVGALIVALLLRTVPK